MRRKMDKKTAGILAVAALAATTAIGGTLAFLTDSDSVTNSFTVSNDQISIEGSEPNWDPDGDGEQGGTAEHVEATQTYAKDPQITNTGKNDCYAYIEVSVPMADVIYTNSDGVRQNGGTAAHIELFEFDATGKTTQTLTDGIGTSEQNDNWTQMYKKEMTIDGQAMMVYTFCYNEVLEPGQTTDSLFDTITFANVVEGQLGDTQLDVDVNFYAIQTVNTGGDGTTVAEQAKNAYDKYVNQNDGQDGAVINDVTN